MKMNHLLLLFVLNVALICGDPEPMSSPRGLEWERDLVMNWKVAASHTPASTDLTVPLVSPTIPYSPRRTAPLESDRVQTLVLLDFDDCIFPTSFQSPWFWKELGKMDQRQKSITLVNIYKMLIDYDDYLANAESPLRKLLDDGCTVEIATNANQSWIDLAMSFLPKTECLLRENDAYPQVVEEDPLSTPPQQWRGGTNKKIKKHKDIVEEFMGRFRETNLGRGLIMAVGDHTYDVAPLQTFMRHKDDWLAPKSSREIDGYTIKMRNLCQYPGSLPGDQMLKIHMKEMRSVFHTMRAIFDMHNNQAKWLAHAQKLQEATIDAEKALNNAFKEYAERRDKRIVYCIPWVQEVLHRELRDKEENEIYEKTTSEFHEACAQTESSSERCRELELHHQETRKAYNIHTRLVINDWHTLPYKDGFAAVPNKKLTFPQTCRKVAELDEGMHRWTSISA